MASGRRSLVQGRFHDLLIDLKSFLFHEPLFLFAIFILASHLLWSCSKEDTEDPGPISVRNTITPSTAFNGSTVQWDIEMTNPGGKVKIYRIHMVEYVISGWSAGQIAYQADMPIPQKTLEAHTITTFQYTRKVFNGGNTDILISNEVTVYSDGGSSNSEMKYKVKEN